MKILLDLATRVPRWIIAVSFVSLAAAWAAHEWGQGIRKLWVRGVEIPASEWAQLVEDKRHVGDMPHTLYGEGGTFAFHYDSGCVLVKHIVGGRIVRTWAPHPSEFAPPPVEHLEHYGGVSHGGIIGPAQCAPFEMCWQPLLDHPRLQESQGIDQKATDDRCWVWRLLETPDGCRWEIPISLCTGEWAWGHARWYCCKGAHG